jgi:choline-glycine betaine transporter
MLDCFPLRDFTFNLPSWIPITQGKIYFSHATSLLGFGILLGLSIWCMVDEESAFQVLIDWKSGVTLKFTWFYIFSNLAFTFFIFWLGLFYSDIKLGKKDEKPNLPMEHTF